MYLQILIAGFGGGAVRGLVGFTKKQFSYKNVPFKIEYFLGTVIISGMIGFLSASAMQNIGFSLEGAFTPALSFIIGYAGGDFIYKVFWNTTLSLRRLSLQRVKI